MEVTGILQYWEQLIFFLGILIVAVRIQSEVTALRNDVSSLQEECKESNKKILKSFNSLKETSSKEYSQLLSLARAKPRKPTLILPVIKSLTLKTNMLLRIHELLKASVRAQKGLPKK